jgi:hypothetical protein
MNDKIPTIDECKYHIQTLCKYGLDLDERHYEKFIMPVFDKLERYKKALLVIAYEEYPHVMTTHSAKQFLVEIAESVLEE